MIGGNLHNILLFLFFSKSRNDQILQEFHSSSAGKIEVLRGCLFWKKIKREFFKILSTGFDNNVPLGFLSEIILTLNY